MPEPGSYRTPEQRAAASKASQRATADAAEALRNDRLAEIQLFLSRSSESDAPYWIEWRRSESPAQQHRRESKLFGRRSAPEDEVTVSAGWLMSDVLWDPPYKDYSGRWMNGVIDRDGRVGSTHHSAHQLPAGATIEQNGPLGSTFATYSSLSGDEVARIAAFFQRLRS